MRKYLNLVAAIALVACSQPASSTDDTSRSGDAGRMGDSHRALEVTGGDAVPDVTPLADSGDAMIDAYVGEPVPLVADGQSDHVILLSDGASASEKNAAAELQAYLLEATEFELPILEAPPAAGTPTIVIGRGTLASQLGVEPTDQELGEQGFYWKTEPPHIVIAGTAAAGTLYGVHRFLEDVVGVRWYAPGVVHVPQLSELMVPPLDGVVSPAFLWRHTSYNWPGKDDAFLTRKGDNSGDKTADHEWGAEHAHDGRAHSYFWYVSPEEFFDEHPEYFSEIGGARIRDETQLCLTNPDVLDIVTERMLQRMADKPHARQHNFSQKDRYNYCTCDACSAMNAKYETTGGTQFWFVNELAKRTTEDYPEKLIGTLAYMYTEEPPVELEMHPNVAVWLCHMYPSCDAHPIATCPHNADYKRRAESWSELVQHLYIWHYIVDFTHYYNPFPNFRAMAADMKFYRDIGVEGIYLQGMGHSGGGGEFSLLRPYYGMKLLWNPDRDPEALRAEFLQGYYGDAAPHIESYLEMLLDEVTDNDIHMHLYTNPGQGYLSDSIMVQADEFFDAAEVAVAADSELLERVKVARMPLLYARFFPRNGYEFAADKLNWMGEMATIPQIKEFLDRMAAHGFQTVREVGGDPSLVALLGSIFQSPLPVKSIENEHLRVEVLASLGGRALRVMHKGSGQQITASNVIPNLFFPFAGGLEDRVGGTFEAYGWVEPATVISHDDLSVTTTQTTLNNYAVKRTFALSSNGSEITQTTELTNLAAAREDRFRFHMELDLGELEETVVEFASIGGEEVTQTMGPVISGLREGVHFYDLDAPDGSWTLLGSNGLAVTQSWDVQQFEFTWLYSYPASLNELEVEVWTPKLTFESGETRTFSQTVSVDTQ
jgi:siroheme synthase